MLLYRIPPPQFDGWSQNFYFVGFYKYTCNKVHALEVRSWSDEMTFEMNLM